MGCSDSKPDKEHAIRDKKVMKKILVQLVGLKGSGKNYIAQLIANKDKKETDFIQDKNLNIPFASSKLSFKMQEVYDQNSINVIKINYIQQLCRELDKQDYHAQYESKTHMIKQQKEVQKYYSPMNQKIIMNCKSQSGFREISGIIPDVTLFKNDDETNQNKITDFLTKIAKNEDDDQDDKQSRTGLQDNISDSNKTKQKK